MKRKVWVAGTLGATPLVVTWSLEAAIKAIVEANVVPGTIKEHGFPQQWTGGFIDGEPYDLCFKTIIHHSDHTAELYVERFDVDEDESDQDDEVCDAE